MDPDLWTPNVGCYLLDMLSFGNVVVWKCWIAIFILIMYDICKYKVNAQVSIRLSSLVYIAIRQYVRWLTSLYYDIVIY